MTDLTRRAALAALGVGLSSGCLSDPLGGWHGSDAPDPDHAVVLRSEADGVRTVRVWVVREATGETVFETTRELSAGGEVELYNTRQAKPDGSEAFRVCGERFGATAGASEGETTDESETTASTEPLRRDCATIETSECYGDVEVVVREDGSIQVVYAVC
jgi:hypothetical protein